MLSRTCYADVTPSCYRHGNQISLPSYADQRIRGLRTRERKLRFRRFVVLTSACVAVAAGAAVGASAGVSQAAAQHPAPRLTWARIFAMTPARVTALQKPLLAAAAPLQTAGRAMRNIYWGTALDTPNHVVDLYVTDPSRAAELIATARRLDPGLKTSLIRVKRAAYSAANLTAAGNRVLAADTAKRLPFTLYGVGQLDRGASLRLQVADVVRARMLSRVSLRSLGGRSVAQLAGVRLTFQQIRRAGPLTRQNDTLPFIGGDALVGPNPEGAVECTAGIPVENSSNRDFLITANHCFTAGQIVTTENGTTHVGIPYRYNTSDDAELIDTGKYNGAGSIAGEGETNTSAGGINFYPLTATDPAWAVGQIFCQDGISSFEDGRGVPCNLYTEGAVTDPDICGANGACNNVNEIETQDDNGSPVATPGDSGGVVFTVASAYARSAAGMVDYGKNCTGPQGSCYIMDFVWAPNLYNAFGYAVRLNPNN
jgi:hypothetical protein